VRVDHRHTAALVGFIREVWDPTATPAAVRRARAAAAAGNPAARGDEAPTFLYLASGRPLGHVSTIPVRLWLGQSEVTAHWVKGLMVLSEHRNGPVGFMLLKEALRHLRTALAMVVQPAPRRLFQALGFRDLGALPNYLRILEPTKVLRRLDLTAVGLEGTPRWAQLAVRLAQRWGLARVGGPAAAGITWAWTAAAGGLARGLDVGCPAEPDVSECDDLWGRVRRHITATPVRDGAYLRWRYDTSESGKYRLGTVHDCTGLAGIAVVRRPRGAGDPRLAGIRVATLSEVIFPPNRPEVGLATLAAAEGIARQVEADALLCSASHRSLRILLRRRAFVPVPGNVHVLARAPCESEAFPEALGEWCLTRGDSNADDVF
jgi:predicted N-acetyltransferase YhbS